MKFGYVGVCFREAALDQREKVSFTDSSRIEFMNRLASLGIRQSMVLSTCNRSEVFYVCEDDRDSKVVATCYQDFFSHIDWTGILREDQGDEAIVYLFRVACGLESLVIGEDQILGQVVESMDFSRTMGHSGKELEKIIRDAIRCAKQIKAQYHISEKPISVSYVGVRQLATTVDLSGKSVLLIGSGKTAQLALTYLMEYDLADISVCSRNKNHASLLLERFSSIQVVSYEKRYECLAGCDVIVSATSSPHTVIREEGYPKDHKTRWFLDLASPRDIDMKLAGRKEVTVINMDSIQQITDENQKEREKLAKVSQKTVQECVDECVEWLHVSRMDHTIQSLQKRCQDIVEDSFAYLDRKLDLNRREKNILKKVLNASLQRLLKEPIHELKQLDTIEEQQKYQDMVEHLFQTGKDFE